MPAGDGTGPMGMGPMSGRAAGYCAGYDRPGYANPVYGQGFGRGRGGGFGGRGGRGGRGFRHRFYATGLPGWMRFGGQPGYAAAPPVEPSANELQWLKAQADQLKERLVEIEKRMADLTATSDVTGDE